MDDVVSLAGYEAAFEDLRASSLRLADDLARFGQSSGDVSAGLHAAIILKEHQKPVHAESVFGTLRTKWKGREDLEYEYIQFLRFFNRGDEADDILVQNLRAGLIGPNIARELIARSYIDGNLSESKVSYFRELLLGLITRFPTQSNLGIIGYLSNIKVSELIRKLSCRKILDVPTVQAKCLDAVRTKAPFCLVRLGDGEGAFLQSQSHSAWDDELLRDHRRFFTRRWYNDPDLACEQDFLQIADELPTMLSNADILGIPSVDWIMQEIRLRNLDTVINCLQIVRLLEDYEIDESRMSVSSVALDLEYHGFLQKILDESGSLSLITSHATLGDHLRQSRRATIRQTILIPPAFSDCEQTGYQLRSSHFKDSFSATIKSIEKTVGPGDVVLIAAGFLGKVYAFRVRQQGGIAFDIGSLADLWMGHMTRPAFRNLTDLQLSRIDR